MNRSVIYFVLFTVLKTSDSTSCLYISPYIHTSQNFIRFLLSFSLLSHIPSEMEQTVFCSPGKYILYLKVLHYFIFSTILYSFLNTTSFPIYLFAFSQHDMMERSYLSVLHSHIHVLFPAGFSELKSSIYK